MIQEGDHVVFKRDDVHKVFQIFKKRQIFFEKAKIRGDQLVGQEYGTMFEVKRGSLVPVIPVTESSSDTGAESVKSGKDNRDLVASEENQKLGQAEIMQMKEEGLSGQEIVGKLVEQSETFKTKTEFSQEKYIKKKKKRHMVEFRVLRPNACLLLDVYKQTAFKICNLRVDSLSQLLCYANIMSGATVAVVESCQGLVLGAVMERMGGVGQVLHLYPGNDMNRHNVKLFNFSAEHMNMLHEFPLNKLAALEDGSFLAERGSASAESDNTAAAGSQEQLKGPNLASGAAAGKPTKESVTEAGGTVADVKSGTVGGMEVSTDEKGESQKKGSIGAEKMDTSREADAGSDGGGDGKNGDGQKDGKDSANGDGDADSHTEENKGQDKESLRQPKKRARTGEADREAKRQERAERLNQGGAILQKKNLDSLVIATKHDPVPLLQRLLPFVAPSRCVVVYSQHKEPLVDCYTQVRDKGLGVQLRLSESWYREYQVLPSRTHPKMSMSGTGGYLLSFLRVQCDS